MRHILKILPVRLRAFDICKATLESLVREKVHILRIGYLGAVDDEGIRIYVRLLRSHGYFPHAAFSLGHRPCSAEHLAFELYLFSLRGQYTECRASVLVVFRRYDSRREKLSH